MGDLSRVISPPYDIISPGQNEELHQSSPYNYVRLVLGREKPGDTEVDNRFVRSGTYLRNWLDDGVLQKDASPALYRSTIRYTLGSEQKQLHGITCLVRLHDYSDGIVLPHERTLRGPKEGLRRLMYQTWSNLDSVWMMYEDNEGLVRSALQTAAWKPAVTDARDPQQVHYSLDMCTDPQVLEAVCKAFASEQLVIADGHHRYETALAFSREVNRENQGGAAGWVMATLCWADDPGLTVLPTHRVVKQQPADVLQALPDNLAGRFTVTDLQPGSVMDVLREEPASSFAAFDGSRAWLARPSNPVDATGAELLQQTILAEQLHFDVENLKTDPRIAYVENADEAMEMASGESGACAFLVKSIPVRTITRYAREQRRLPQKATYFYPKLASGLVLRQIAEDVGSDG